MDTKSNPADNAPRTLRPIELSKWKWIKGPEFLCKNEAEWQVPLPEAVTDLKLVDDDPEVKRAVSLATEVFIMAQSSRSIEVLLRLASCKKGRCPVSSVITKFKVTSGKETY